MGAQTSPEVPRRRASLDQPPKTEAAEPPGKRRRTLTPAPTTSPAPLVGGLGLLPPKEPSCPAPELPLSPQAPKAKAKAPRRSLGAKKKPQPEATAREPSPATPRARVLLAATPKKAPFDYGQAPMSKAMKALVTRSVEAAENDETASESRLVDLSTGMVRTLPHDGVVAIGRCAGCEIILNFPVVDSRHCVLMCSDGQVYIEDVGDQGTFVNDTQVPKGNFLPQRIILRRGDTLALADPDGPKFLFLDAAPSHGGA